MEMCGRPPLSLPVFLTLVVALVWIPKGACDVNTEMKSLSERCCALGTSLAADSQRCGNFTIPVANVRPIDNVLCVKAVKTCCIRQYRKKTCKKGIKMARAGLDCVHGKKHQLHCCNECKLGFLTGSLGRGCTVTFGKPWDSTFLQCCYEALKTTMTKKDLVTSPMPTFSTDTTSTSSNKSIDASYGKTTGVTPSTTLKMSSTSFDETIDATLSVSPTISSTSYDKTTDATLSTSSTMSSTSSYETTDATLFTSSTMSSTSSDATIDATSHATSDTSSPELLTPENGGQNGSKGVQKRYIFPMAPNDICNLMKGLLCTDICVPTRGSYYCRCPENSTLLEDGKTCRKNEPEDSKTNFSDEQDFNDTRSEITSSCNNTFILGEDGYSCSCPAGYEYNKTREICVDINECASDRPCTTSSESCINLRGSYRCKNFNCPAGYSRDPGKKTQCRKLQSCADGDLVCLRAPFRFSHNVISLTNMFPIPKTGQLDIFAMNGDLLPGSKEVDFSIALVNVSAPPDVVHATDTSFALKRPSSTQAVLVLTQSIPGPQNIELHLSMEIYHENRFTGRSVAKIFIFVTKYKF